VASDIRCPICGGTTTIRAAKAGPDAGWKFYVCDRYPECKGKVAPQARGATAAPAKPGTRQEQGGRAAQDEIARYKAEQEAIIREEEAGFEKYKSEQEDIITVEKAKFEGYKAEQQALIDGEKEKFEKYRLEQVAELDRKAQGGAGAAQGGAGEDHR
jgi:ssDNA-binding Zn-finger/Zn-ribbon topoisomerase 1